MKKITLPAPARKLVAVVSHTPPRLWFRGEHGVKVMGVDNKIGSSICDTLEGALTATADRLGVYEGDEIKIQF